MYEAKERQKFISDAKYLREMQHKKDTDYQACLRNQEQTREQSEKKREQHARQAMRQTSVSSVSAVLLPINRQVSSDEVSGSELKSSVKSPGNKTEAKFPAIVKTPVKQKQKAGTISKKTEKIGTYPKNDISALQKPVLSRRQRMNQRSFLESPDSEHVKRAEEKGRKTPLLQGTTKMSRGSGPQDSTGQRNAPKNKKKAQGRRNLVQTSKFSIDGKSLDRDLKKANVFTAAQQVPTHPAESTVLIANGPLIRSDSNSSSLPPIKNVAVRHKEEKAYAELCSNIESNEDLLSFDLSNSPCDQTNRVHEMSLTQSEHYTYEMGVGDDGQRAELSHQLVRQHNIAAGPATERSSIEQKQTVDHRKSYTTEENLSEDNHKKEDKKSASSTRSPCTESKPEGASANEPVGNLNSTEDWSRSSIYGSPIRMRDSFSATESCQSSSPTISTFEDSSLLEDSLSNGLSSLSPSTASHDEDTLLTSHNSSSTTDSSQPSLFWANFTAHLHMPGRLPDQLPIFLTVSDLRNPSSIVNSATVCSSPNTKELNKCETDPEKLKKLQESLLAEDSEEEGDQCRICQIAGGSIANPLLEPCRCGGTLRFVHQECLKTWLKAKIKSGAELGAVKTCELCKQSLAADLDDFNVNDYYRNHQQSQAQSELMNSGLYLVLLLHLYEQRFAELMRLNYNQASRERLSRQRRTEENQSSANSGNTG